MAIEISMSSLSLAIKGSPSPDLEWTSLDTKARRCHGHQASVSGTGSYGGGRQQC